MSPTLSLSGTFLYYVNFPLFLIANAIPTASLYDTTLGPKRTSLFYCLGQLHVNKPYNVSPTAIPDSSPADGHYKVEEVLKEQWQALVNSHLLFPCFNG